MGGPASDPTLRTNLAGGILLVQWHRMAQGRMHEATGPTHHEGIMECLDSFCLVISNSHPLPPVMQLPCNSGILETVCLHWGHDEAH